LIPGGLINDQHLGKAADSYEYNNPEEHKLNLKCHTNKLFW